MKKILTSVDRYTSDCLYVGEDGTELAREKGTSPHGVPFNDDWVLRNPAGEYIDHDQFRNDIAERNGIELLDSPPKPIQECDETEAEALVQAFQGPLLASREPGDRYNEPLDEVFILPAGEEAVKKMITQVVQAMQEAKVYSLREQQAAHVLKAIGIQ